MRRKGVISGRQHFNPACLYWRKKLFRLWTCLIPSDALSWREKDCNEVQRKILIKKKTGTRKTENSTRRHQLMFDDSHNLAPPHTSVFAPSFLLSLFSFFSGPAWEFFLLQGTFLCRRHSKGRHSAKRLRHHLHFCKCHKKHKTELK